MGFGFKLRTSLLARDWSDFLQDNLAAKDAAGANVFDYADKFGTSEDVRGLLMNVVDRAARRQKIIQAVRDSEAIHTCHHGCGAQVPFHRLHIHHSHECENRLVQCEKCGVELPEHAREAHKKDDCVKRYVRCSNWTMGCMETMAEEFRVPHEIHHCKYRIVGCRLECGKRMRLHFRSEHEQDHCRLRTLWCDRCNAGMHAYELADHPPKCPERTVPCPKQDCPWKGKIYHVEAHLRDECIMRPLPCGHCGELFSPKDRREIHERFLCPLRFVDCKLGCGERIAEHEREAHERDDCVLREVPCPHGCGALMQARQRHAHVGYTVPTGRGRGTGRHSEALALPRPGRSAGPECP